jgi:serine/threonine protein kinase
MNFRLPPPKPNEKKKKKSEIEVEKTYCRGLTTSVKKTKPLTMHDYKKFKLVGSIESKYKFGSILGQGAFGQVKRCTHLDTGNEFAIKIMKKTMIQKRKIYVKLLENELSILGSKSHPKIIRIVDLMEDLDHFYVVSEIVEGGELFKRLCVLENFSE